MNTYQITCCNKECRKKFPFTPTFEKVTAALSANSTTGIKNNESQGRKEKFIKKCPHCGTENSFEI